MQNVNHFNETYLSLKHFFSKIGREESSGTVLISNLESKPTTKRPNVTTNTIQTLDSNKPFVDVNEKKAPQKVEPKPEVKPTQDKNPNEKRKNVTTNTIQTLDSNKPFVDVNERKAPQKVEPKPEVKPNQDKTPNESPKPKPPISPKNEKLPKPKSKSDSDKKKKSGTSV